MTEGDIQASRIVMNFFVILALVCSFAGSLGQCPDIISRSEWGARDPVNSPTWMDSPVPYTVIHHGESGSCTTQSACAAIVRSYQNYHIDSNGWNDIGYSFVVGEDGNVYEGRGWNAVGAHCPGYNSNSIGICVIGNFMDRVPNAAAQAAVKSLIQCGVSQGYIQQSYSLIGHRQGYSTDCPGDAFYALIQDWPHWDPNP